MFRIRKHSEGSVEIFPEFIEEHKITSEYRNPSLSGSNENIDGKYLFKLAFEVVRFTASEHVYFLLEHLLSYT